MAQSERSAARIGEVVERQFRLDALLSEGAMGPAYLAEQLAMGRRAVVKLLHARADQPFRERFAREAKRVARLDHPNIAQIYACGETADSVPYLAMEYADGVTLKHELAEHGPLGEMRVLHIGQQICKALAEAHRLGIVHRALKPENVMLVQRDGDPDVVKLLDFGIASLGGLGSAGGATRLTETGMVFGTPQYMAPEQIRSGVVDGRADLYALGLVLYELLAGAPAMAGDSEFDVLTRQVTEAPPRLGSLGVAVSPRLEQAILGCLEKAPEQRWANALDLGAALAAAAHELSVRARETHSSRPPLASGPRPIPFDAASEDVQANTRTATPPAQYTNYDDKLPLPRALKPLAPWIVSLLYAVLMMSLGFSMQWCNTHVSR